MEVKLSPGGMGWDGWSFYDCRCGFKGKRFIACAEHYFSRRGPVENLARAAHMKDHPNCGVYIKDGNGQWQERPSDSS